MKKLSHQRDPEKAFNVVFERQTPMSDEETQSDYPIINSRTNIIRDVTKQVLRKRFEEIQSEHQETNLPEPVAIETKFTRLLDAVGRTAVKENRATDKFVDDVEQMMNCFNKDMGKLQTAYKNIMDKLPKI